MYRNHFIVPNADSVQQSRNEAGRWLKSLREGAGMSQKQLAQAVGFEYYTFISQLESGRGRLPQGQYMAFSQALNVPLREFVKTMTRYYDPITYYALFESEELPASTSGETAGRDDLAARLERLEALIANKNS